MGVKKACSFWFQNSHSLDAEFSNCGTSFSMGAIHLKEGTQEANGSKGWGGGR